MSKTRDREKKSEKETDKKKKPVYEIKFQDNTAAMEEDILRENPPKLSYLTKLFHYVFSSARLMCGIFLGLAILLSILQPVTAFLWGEYVDSASSYQAVSGERIQLLSLIGLAVLYWLLRFLGDLTGRYLYGGEDIERLSKVQDHRLQEKFQSRLFEKIARLCPEYMEVPRINDMIERCFNSMGSEWSSLQRGVMIEGYVIIAKAVSVIIVAASLYLFHPLLCLVVLIAPIPTLYTTYIGNRLQFKFSRDNQEILREAGYYQGLLLGTSAKEVKAFNLFDFFFGKWKALADDYVIREKKNQRNVFLLGTASGLVSNLANVGANILAILLLTQGKLSVGALGAVFALIGTLMGSTTQLFGSIANFLSKKNEAAQFFELIDLREQMQGDYKYASGEDAPDVPAECGSEHGGENSAEPCNQPDIAGSKAAQPNIVQSDAASAATALPDASQPTSARPYAALAATDLSEESRLAAAAFLEASNVSYRYPLTDEYRIKDVSFRIEKGEKVAFVGENGAGKTTFVKLLTGMLEPSMGQIFLDGRNAEKVDSTYRYDFQACVFQEPARFHSFTIADNVFLGDVGKEREEEQIDTALAFAGLEGMDKTAMLGKDIGGTDLSGGQWQKLAIARACYRDRNLIILDEPTSNLDPIAEAEVFRKYLAMTQGKTVIMVTHRISVAALADRIVVFKDGKIAEDGTHEDLLSRNGEYARLYSAQAEWYDR